MELLACWNYISQVHTWNKIAKITTCIVYLHMVNLLSSKAGPSGTNGYGTKILSLSRWGSIPSVDLIRCMFLLYKELIICKRRHEMLKLVTNYCALITDWRLVSLNNTVFSDMSQASIEFTYVPNPLYPLFISNIFFYITFYF